MSVELPERVGRVPLGHRAHLWWLTEGLGAEVAPAGARSSSGSSVPGAPQGEDGGGGVGAPPASGAGALELQAAGGNDSQGLCFSWLSKGPNPPPWQGSPPPDPPSLTLGQRPRAQGRESHWGADQRGCHGWGCSNEVLGARRREVQADRRQPPHPTPNHHHHCS